MVLLHLLHQLKFHDLVVCHLNHQLRGAAATADALLVETSASQLGYPLLQESTDVAALATAHKQSIETTARAARHEFFQRCLRQTGATQIFLAHHADDQAETVLMNVLRGTGLHGLGGMRLRTRMDPAWEIIRPLLTFTRAEIRAWAATHDVKFNEDASNASPDYLRNRLRHELLPAARTTMQRDVTEALGRLAIMSQADDEYLTAAAAERFPPLETLSPQALLAAPLALQRRALQAWLQEHQVPLITFELIEQIRAILPTTAATAKCNLPGGRWVRRRAGVLFIESAAEGAL
jgi:tRNA(Ile)-lysidine synthase